MQNLGYMFAAFLVIWLAVFGYLLTLTNRQQRLSRDIEQLKAALKEKTG